MSLCRALAEGLHQPGWIVRAVRSESVTYGSVGAEGENHVRHSTQHLHAQRTGRAASHGECYEFYREAAQNQGQRRKSAVARPEERTSLGFTSNAFGSRASLGAAFAP